MATVKFIGATVAAAAGGTEADVTIPAGVLTTDPRLAAFTPVWGIVYKNEDVTGSTAIALGSFTPDFMMPVGTPDGDFRSDTAQGFRHIVNGGIRAVVSTQLHVDSATSIGIVVDADNAARVYLNGTAVGAGISQETGAARTLNLVAGWNTLDVTFISDAAGAAASDFLRILGSGSPLGALVGQMRCPLPVGAASASVPKATAATFGTVETDITESGGSTVPTMTTYSANKTNTDATTSEVLAARVEPANSPFVAQTFSTLKTRLDTMIARIAALVNRTISPGTGLTGGGDLSANRTLGLDVSGATTGQVLTKTSGGVGWQTPAAAGTPNFRQLDGVAGSVTLLDTDRYIAAYCKVANWSALLPATPSANQVVTITMMTGGSRTVTVGGNGHLISGASSYALSTQYQSVTLEYMSDFADSAGGGGATTYDAQWVVIAKS